MTIRIAVFILAASSAVLAQRAVPPARSHHPDIPYQSPTSLGAATYAKVLCSGGVRVGPRCRGGEAEQRLLPDDRARSRQERSWRMWIARRSGSASRWTTSTRTAAFYGDQGCVIHPVGSRRRALQAGARSHDVARCRDASVADGRCAVHRAMAGRSRSREDAGGRRSRVRGSRGPHRGDGRALQGPDRRRALHGRHHQRHAARKLVDGQEPHRHAGRPGDQGWRVHTRRSGAGARLAAARRSARRHPRARRDEHVERLELHRPGRSLDGSDLAVSRSLLHLRRRRRCVQVRDRRRRWSSRRTPWAAIAIPIR